MANFQAPVLITACILVAACQMHPSITFLATGDQGSVISLTDDVGNCTKPTHVAYVTALDGTSLPGCWERDHSQILVHFNDMEDKRVPVGDFRQTELGGYHNVALN
ncbi:MAG: hypothetical protein JSS56_05745 [Proteobacteria bacterium]|nr:hypothetical protein [Pseudomonadota bacterium]